MTTPKTDVRKLQRVVIDALEDIKAQDLAVLDTSHLTSVFDRVVVATATSNRQTRALASHVHTKVKAAGFMVLSTEGEETGEWVLVDLGDMVVHIMQPSIRAYYRLEELWGDKRVRVKLNPHSQSKPEPGIDYFPANHLLQSQPLDETGPLSLPNSTPKTTVPKANRQANAAF